MASTSSQMIRNVQSMLVIFEAAARLGSFSLAAEELNLTQSAISHAVRKLEVRLGAELFKRRRSGLGLTWEGERLLRCAQQSIALADSAIHEITRRRDPRSNSLAVAVSTSMARYWLMPRLPQLMRALPDLRLWIQTVDRDVDLYAEGIDLGIVFGSNKYNQYDQIPLWAERVVPICSPEYLRRHGPFDTLEQLGETTLIHYEERERPRVSWPQWFEANALSGLTTDDEVRFADYSLVLEAAVSGKGVALGWHPIIDDLLRAKRLVLARPEYYSGSQIFSLIAPRGALAGGLSRKFLDWVRIYRPEAGNRLEVE